MAIPKTIYQTFKTAKLPLINRWHIQKFRSQNPAYEYEFYTDSRIDDFFITEYGNDITNAYRKVQIGAAKADFFRYAILYKWGGIYLDVDSAVKAPFNSFIPDDDVAIITREKNPGLYAQWALIYAPGHPFLEKTINLILQNIAENKYPHDVHQMTGPSVYTKAINECLIENPDIPHRVLGVDYEGCLKFKIPLSKLMYSRGEHWKKAQLIKPVLKS